MNGRAEDGMVLGGQERALPLLGDTGRLPRNFFFPDEHKTIAKEDNHKARKVRRLLLQNEKRLGYHLSGRERVGDSL